MKVFSPAGFRTGKLIARWMFVSLGTGPTNGATLGLGDTAAQLLRTVVTGGIGGEAALELNSCFRIDRQIEGRKCTSGSDIIANGERSVRCGQQCPDTAELAD
jgi:hypothetical protein